MVGVAPLFCDCRRHTKDVLTLFFIGNSNIFNTATLSCNPFLSQANLFIKISESTPTTPPWARQVFNVQNRNATSKICINRITECIVVYFKKIGKCSGVSICRIFAFFGVLISRKCEFFFGGLNAIFQNIAAI